MWNIFAAIFSAGVVSLLLELSLLREFVFVIGSSAFSNSLIISIFLAGLAAGTYFSTWKRVKAKNEGAARSKFAVLQFSLIVFILLFYVTKEYFIYVSPNQGLIIAYFILATFIPSFIAGASYSTMVELLYHKGERYIIFIYAYSTLGNVVGGLMYGYVFVYLMGIQASYTCAAFFSTIAIALVYPLKKKLHSAAYLLIILTVALVIQGNYINTALYRFEKLLFQQYSPFGLVEVWQMDDGQAIDMTINNVHQYYSYNWDRQFHTQWATTTLDITNRPSDVLLLGYGSGVSSAAFLQSGQTNRVDTVENCGPVLEVGKRFFPKEYQLVTTSARSRIIVQDFRNFIRFTNRTYDIVILDHSILDPYYGGFFTLEFFNQLKRVLKPHGVIAMLGTGISWDTTQSSFPYIYKNTTTGDDQWMYENEYFLSMEPFDPRLASRYALQEQKPKNSPVYSDHRIYGNSFKTAMRVVK